MAKWPEVCSSTPKLNTVSPRIASEMGGYNHGHAILARPENAPTDYAADKRTAGVFPALKKDSVECNDWGANPKGHAGYQADFLKAHITICMKNGIAEETTRKVTDSLTRSTKENHH